MTVTLKRLDHVNLRTANLQAMVDWYGRMLGMTPGPRPDFGFPGAWLYAGDQPIIHLVGCDAHPGAADGDLRIEHFAISAVGLLALVQRAEVAGERVQLRKVPGPSLIPISEPTSPY